MGNPMRTTETAGTEVDQSTIDLVDAFLSEVRAHPASAAIAHNGVSTSYEELSSLAGRIAASIQQVTSQPSPRVLLALPPSVAAYAAMVGTLMAGGTFCPLNIDGPESRNANIARDFSPDVIIFDGNPLPFLDAPPATTPRINASQPAVRTLDTLAPQYSEIAYIVFTSGSSGQPKGVKIGRAAFSYFLTIARRYFNLTLGERWGQFSNLGYDLAVMDVFLTLTQGGTLVPLATGKEQLMPATAIREQNIAVWQSVPSVVELMIRANQVSAEHLAPLRIMSFCGEPLLPRQLKALFAAKPDLQIFNTYGTTETIGFNTINRLNADNYQASCDAPTVALGQDVPGWELSLHGDNPADEGEIVVSSEFLSLGYWRDEDRTRDVFRQLRNEKKGERRSYFTGDWGIRKNSMLYFSSRIDRQVKIRGERIELNEIDFCLREAGFASAHTVLAGEELHSFVESADGIDQERVRALLAKRLPFHAVPKTIRSLATLPRNPNGKIDAAALKQLVSS
jgi:D-alanine--poly(phosphoribitol) ligase subunit 1